MSEQKIIRVVSRSKKGLVSRIIVRSASDARRRYVVTKKKQWACSCPIWIYRRGYLSRKFPKLSATKLKLLVAQFHCKHIKGVC